MRIALLGSIYGHITETYKNLGKQVYETGIPIDWVISTGNFGVWPDPLRADKASREEPGDFLEYLSGKRNLPIPTLMVAGKHEDHFWLDRKIKRQEGELVFNLHLLANGNHTTIENNDTMVRVVGVGGTYSPNPGLGNYCQADVHRACAAGHMDLFLAHEGPDGQRFEELTSQAKGLNKVCFATQPRLLVHGKYADNLIYKTSQTLTKAVCIGNKRHLILDITKDSMVIS
jgi:hypothetical protein